MADGGLIELNFRARLEQLERDMAGARSKVSRAADEMGDDANDRFGKKLGGLAGTIGKAAVLGIGAAAVGIGALLKSSVAAAEESRKVGAQTAAVIESTGGAANVSAAQVADYADKLAGLTGIDDEVVAGGQNMLLTFTNVRNEAGKGNDIFNQATKAALNMSVALGKDLPGSAMLVGKALNDPIAGMTALTRSGVQFTAQQKEQVKAMVAAGDTLGAQKVILKELETQFGGSAEAAASPMARLKVVVGNLQEELGARFLPVVGKVAGFLADKLPPALDAVGKGFSFLVAGFKDPAAVQGPANFLDVLFNLGAGVRTLFEKFKEWWPAIKQTVVSAVEAIVGWVQANWPKIKSIITETMETVRSVIAGVVDVITTIWDNFGSQIMAVVSAAWDFISGAIENAMNIIQGIIKVVTGIIHGDWGRVWEGIKQILSAAWDQIKNSVELGLRLAREVISVGWELVKGVFTGAWDALKGIVREGIAWIVDKFLGMVETVVRLAAKAFGWVPGIGPKLQEAAEDVRRFRDETNAALRGIEDKDIHVRIYQTTYIQTVYGEEARSSSGGRQLAYADGGYFTRPTFGLFAEAGPELLLPLTDMDRTRELLAQAGLLGESSLGDMGHWNGGGDGGGTTVILNIAGSVTTERELVDAVRRGIAGTSRYTGSTGF